MTRKEIADKYLAELGMKSEKGDCFEFVVPFIILDLVYDLYCKFIAPLDVKFELKR